MTDLFHLRDSDRGRPVTEIVSQLRYDDLKQDVQKVLRLLNVIEKELQLPDKNLTFIMRIRPYRTADNVIDGVVITFVDISDRKKAEIYQSLLMETRSPRKEYSGDCVRGGHSNFGTKRISRGILG